MMAVMGEILAFIIGLAFKAIIAATLGGFFNKLADHAVEYMKDWPRISHYLLEHGGKSFGCHECTLVHEPTSVDGIH